MKNNTAFDELGKRANRFSQPVAIVFALLGVGSLFLGYGFRDSFRQAISGGDVPTIETTDYPDATVADNTGDSVTTPADKAALSKIQTTSNKAVAKTDANNALPASQIANLSSGTSNINKADLANFTQKDTFGKALIRGGVSPTEAYLATEQARKVFPLSSLGENQVVKLDFGRTLSNQPFLKQFSVRVGDTSELFVKRLENGSFEASLNQLAVNNAVKLYRFKIDKSGGLNSSAEAAGLSPENINNMVNLLGLDINLQTDINENDLIQLLFDDSGATQANELGGNLRVVLISSAKTGKDNAFFYYVDDAGTIGYYNNEGKSQRKMLLATPVDGARLVSNFGMRLHPVLGFTRAHKGIDFAAPTGTKVKASGDGVVEVLRWENGYGNYLKIRHRDGYSTAYAHLSRYEKGITVGSKVKQGQIIAYVGNTGLSTGSHLHYEILVNNDQVNPTTVKLPALRALAGNDLSRFQVVKKDALLRIQNAQIMVKQ